MMTLTNPFRHHRGVGKSPEGQFRETLDLGWSLGFPKDVVLPRQEHAIPRIIAVGGGKGGVGKSLVSANLAAKLGAQGCRVLVIDLDLGCANLHTHFGMGLPESTLADFLLHRTHGFPDLVLDTGIRNVSLIAGGREQAWQPREQGQAYLRLWNAILRARDLAGCDYVVLDLGAGTHQYTMDFFALAHMGLVVALPEPTSIENAYVFMKAGLWRLVENAAHRSSHGSQIQKIRRHVLRADSKVSTTEGYAQRFQAMQERFPDAVGALNTMFRGREIGLILNQARSQQDIDIGRSMEVISRRYFGFQTSYLGYLNYDESVWKSLKNRRLLVSDFPHSLLSQRLTEVSQRIIQRLSQKGKVQNGR